MNGGKRRIPQKMRILLRLRKTEGWLGAPVLCAPKILEQKATKKTEAARRGLARPTKRHFGSSPRCKVQEQ